MSDKKPIVFISHITEEKELAFNFKELIESSFLGMFDVFVSSDEHSIALGQKWLDKISNSLHECVIEIILCSPKSILRPWINFEAGAGWIRNIPVIPLCHSGLELRDLPMPLNLLQAAKISEIPSLKSIFPALAQALNAKTPNIDLSDFLQKVKVFEEKYTFWDQCNKEFSQLQQLVPNIISSFNNGQSEKLQLTEMQIMTLTTVTQFLRENKILELQRNGGVTISGGFGMTQSFTLVPLDKYKQIQTNKLFCFYQEA